MSRKPEIIDALWHESDMSLGELAKSLAPDQEDEGIRQDLRELIEAGVVEQKENSDHEWLYRLSAAGILARPVPPTHEEIHGILRDPERPYPFFHGGCPAPLKREGIEWTELRGACPIQAEGRVNGPRFTFWARYGRWEMQIEQRGTLAPSRYFSGDDRWEGHMPPSVAFALVVSKLLWHVCGGLARPWPGLGDLSDEHLVDLHSWLIFHEGWRTSDLRRMHNAVLVETDRRQWPEGWWEDPSVVLEAR